MANGIVLDVNSATQPAFLQQAVALDTNTKSLMVLGEVNKRYVVSPDVDGLLAAMNEDDLKGLKIEGEETMLTMDTT